MAESQGNKEECSNKHQLGQFLSFQPTKEAEEDNKPEEQH
jgi:hypothetical protein